MSGPDEEIEPVPGRLYDAQEFWGYIDCRTGNICFVCPEPFYVLYIDEFDWYGKTMQRAWSFKTCSIVLFYPDRKTKWIDVQ